MTLPDVEVGRVMARRDLERAGAELPVHGGVADDLHPALDHGHQDLSPDQTSPPVVLGVHRDGRVGQDRLRPRRRDDHVRRAGRNGIGPRVTHIAQLIGADDVLRLEIGVGRPAREAPMDDPVRTVQVPPPVEADEMDPHAPLHVGIHREVHPRPVEGTAEHPELPVDARLVVLHPPPHLAKELLPIEAFLLLRRVGPLLLRAELLGELLLDDDLGDDPSVVRSREPERRLAAHPMPPGHEILVPPEAQGVPEVQVAGHVR